MLRLYKPIEHDIFKLQAMLEHLVCNVWCEANEDETCESKLDAEFKAIYNSYEWLKNKVDEIYTKFIPLSIEDKQNIKNAFITDNKIEELCNGDVSPIYLNALPDIVENEIKPLLVNFYETLLERASVPGTKKDYYEKLIEENDFQYCPCCGLEGFESADSKLREAFDHYLPKAHYPFASVNFNNLVPLCYKCNSGRKKAKDPIKHGRKAFYPFIVEGKPEHHIEIKITIDKSKDLGKLDKEDLTIGFDGDTEKIGTWDSLFDIKERYNDTTRSISKTLLQRIKRRHQLFKKNNTDWSYDNTLDFLIDDYENDLYEDRKFLKKPFMVELKSSTNLIEVYG